VIQGLSTVQIISNLPQQEGTEQARDKVVIKRVYLEKAGSAGK
jgi:hypothetical protein